MMTEKQKVKYKKHKLTKEWTDLIEELGGKCVRCGFVLPLEMDHIIPKHQNGPDTFDNIQPLCTWCNNSKRENFNWLEQRRKNGFPKTCDVKLSKKHPCFTLQPKEIKKKNPDAVALGHLGGLKGGKARWAKLSDQERSELAKKMTRKGWENKQVNL